MDIFNQKKTNSKIKKPKEPLLLNSAPFQPVSSSLRKEESVMSAIKAIPLTKQASVFLQSSNAGDDSDEIIGADV